MRLLTCIISIYFINTKELKNTYCNNNCKNYSEKKALIKNDENNNLDEKEGKNEEDKKKEEDENLKLKYSKLKDKIKFLKDYNNDTFEINKIFPIIEENEFNKKNINDKKKELEEIEGKFCNLLDGIINSLRKKHNSLVEQNKKQNKSDKINIDIKDSDFIEAKTNINKIIEIDKKLESIKTSFNTNIETFKETINQKLKKLKLDIEFIEILKVDDFYFNNIQQEIEKSNNKNELIKIDNKIIEFETKFKNKINEKLNSFKIELINYKKQILDLSSSLYLPINLKIKKEINNYKIDKFDNLTDYENITDKLKEFNKFIEDNISKILEIYNKKIEKLNIKNDNLNKLNNLIDDLKNNDTSKISEIENIIKKAIIEKYKNIKLSDFITDEKFKNSLEKIKKFKRKKDVKIESKNNFFDNFFDNFFSKSNNYEYTEGPFLPKEYLELLIKIIKQINIDNETYLDILTAKLNDIEIDLSKYDETLEYDKLTECEKNKDIDKHKKNIKQIVLDVNRIGTLYKKLNIDTDENKDELKNLFYRINLNYVNNNNCDYIQEMNNLCYNSLFMFIKKDNNNNLYYNELLLYKIFSQILKKEINIDKNEYFLKLDKDVENTFLSYSKRNIIDCVYFFNYYFNYNTKPILDYLNFYYKDLLQSKSICIDNKLIAVLLGRFINIFFNESFLKEIVILLLIDGNFLFDLYINYIIYCLEKAKKNNFNEEILYTVNDLFKKD